MIYPSSRAVLVCAAGGGVALALAAIAPSLWPVGGGWVVLTALLLLADGLLSPSRRALTVTQDAPASIGLARETLVAFGLAFPGRRPRAVEAALGVNERLTVERERVTLVVDSAETTARFSLRPNRRGEGRLEHLWVRWRGPLGLLWKQRTLQVDQALVITPDLNGVKDEAVRMFSRTNPFGSRIELETGEGSEFHALREFTAGMDRRAVDWKQSARHGMLLAKEYRTERNQPVVLALDAGRAMSEPVAGQARIDRAITAALLLGYTSLKLGDRVALYSFDSRPRASSIDYSAEESNYTLALTGLAADLERRSLIVVFTEFADAVGAELMIENVGRLMDRHLVLFVAFRDEALERVADAEPQTAEDVSRAVVAASLLRTREMVLRRLRHMGAEIVDAPAEQVGPALLNSYLDIKRRQRL